MLWPPRTSDRSALAYAYVELLRWPLILDGVPAAREQVQEVFTAELQAVVQTGCSRFDAVTVPYVLGSAALLDIERRPTLFPCLKVGDEVITFLVRAGTGGYLASLSCRIDSGEGPLLTLPPSPGVQWDTPPWDTTAPGPAPLDFPHGELLRTSLESASRRGGAQ